MSHIKSLKPLFWLGLVLVASPNKVFAKVVGDGLDETFSKRVVIQSAILKEDRPILIHLPRDYQVSGELVTFIDRNYRTSTLRVLFGRSASATFAIFAMVTCPDLFNAYIASSPSFYVNKDLIRVKTRNFFETRQSFNKVLFMNLGTEDSRKRVDQTSDYSNLLKQVSPPDFRWELRVINGEGHVPVTSLGDGLQMIFKLKGPGPLIQ